MATKHESHQWTQADKLLIKKHYGKHAPEPLPAEEIARMLGDWATPRKVARMANQMSLRIRRPFRVILFDEAQFRRLHAKGFSDRQIADALKNGCSHRQVFVYRKKLGLPSNYAFGDQSEPVKKRRARSVSNYWRLKGYRHIAHYRLARTRIACSYRKLGCETPLECAIIEAIEAGHCTTKAIVQAAKVRHPYFSVIAKRMMKRGVLSRQQTGKTHVYSYVHPRSRGQVEED